MHIPEVSVLEADELLRGPHSVRLIDVREAEEWEACRILGAEWIPLSQWPESALAQLKDPSEHLLIQCHHGGRSARAAAFLMSRGFTRVFNVSGGIDAWSLQVDQSVPRY
jgi:rhodanese-related sulfurtransferase